MQLTSDLLRSVLRFGRTKTSLKSNLISVSIRGMSLNLGVFRSCYILNIRSTH